MQRNFLKTAKNLLIFCIVIMSISAAPAGCYLPYLRQYIAISAAGRIGAGAALL